MNVGDLIEVLQEYSSDTEVYILEHDGNFCVPAVEYDESNQFVVMW